MIWSIFLIWYRLNTHLTRALLASWLGALIQTTSTGPVAVQPTPSYAPSTMHCITARTATMAAPQMHRALCCSSPLHQLFSCVGHFEFWRHVELLTPIWILSFFKDRPFWILKWRKIAQWRHKIKTKYTVYGHNKYFYQIAFKNVKKKWKKHECCEQKHKCDISDNEREKYL